MVLPGRRKRLKLITACMALCGHDHKLVGYIPIIVLAIYLMHAILLHDSFSL